MNTLAIAGCSIGGALIGSIVGALYGSAVDKSDFPMLMIFTGPMGGVIGAVVGAVAGSAIIG